MKDRLGFIGLGIMGMPMAKNLLKAGFSLVAYNRTKSKLHELSALGANLASSPGDVAKQVDVIITMVTDSPDVEEIVLGPGGIVEEVRPGSVVIDMSTIAPKVSENLATRLSEHGAKMLDAPVSGGQWGAINGSLAIMVGGNKEAFQRCLPILQVLGQSIVHMGPSGSGQMVKLMNQVLVSGTLNSVCEALLFGMKAGVDIDKALEVVMGGAAGSWQLANLGPRIAIGDFNPGFMVRLQQKDLRLILDTAGELGLPLPGTSLVHQLYRSLESTGDQDLGTQALFKVHQRLAGMPSAEPPSG